MKSFQTILIKSSLLLFIILSFSNCEQKIREAEKTNDQLVITEYIANNENYSEFSGLLEITGLDNLLSIRGPYSLFLPNNTAMKAYYSKKGITSYKDLDTIARRELALNHVVGQEFAVSDFQLGTLGEKNALGDNVVIEFQGFEIIVNKTAKIIKRDVRVSNGTIQMIDAVMEPLKLSTFDVLAANPSFSIFTEGLVRTGLKDTLQIISFKYGKGEARTRFTILAIADSTFARYGINSIDALISTYTNDPSTLKSIDNGFYQYMDFHILDKNAYYYSDFLDAATLYSVLSKNNNIQIKKVDSEIRINEDTIAQTKTGLYLDQSNIPGKNGVIHTINTLLPVTAAAPTVLIWEVTDYFDFKQGEYYLKHFEKFFDPEQFEGIRWEGDYLQYYIKAAADAQAQMNEDCLNMIGFWKIEVTTPKIMKGKYSLAGRVWANNVDFAVYIDGVQSVIIRKTDTNDVDGVYTADTNGLFNFGSVDWTTTAEHKIQLVALSSGSLFWDRVEFKPVSEK